MGRTTADPDPVVGLRGKDEAEHLDFLRDFAALQLEMALRWASRDGVALSTSIVERTFLVCLTPWHDGQLWDYRPEHPAQDGPWQAFLAQADAAALAGAGIGELGQLLPDPSDRVPRDLAALDDPVSGLAAWPSSLRADADGAPMSGLLTQPGEDPAALDFHIANNRYPESFLADPRWLAGDLLALADVAQEHGFTALGTTSWLNENPRWLAAFPQAWSLRRSGDYDIGPHLGCWGQVLTSRQTLAPAAVEHLRATGEFRYRMRTSWAWLDEVRRSAAEKAG